MLMPHDMQLPTHPRLHIRNAQDAHIVLEAVRIGLLQPITRRLNDSERSVNIRSGTIFVWEESDREAGIKRWTDGRLWSQSHMREPFLFYDEKLPEEKYALSESTLQSYRFVDGTCRGIPTPAVAHYDRSNHHPKGLVKQAYSAKVILTPGGKPRKWHLTAYFSYEDLEDIPTIENDTALSRISPPPPGLFWNGKTRSKDNGGVYSSQRRMSLDTSSSSSSSAPPSPSRKDHSLPAFRHQSPHPPILCPTPGLTLPPLHAAVQTHPHPSGSLFFGGGGRLPQTRAAEDQRMIRILNAKHLG